MPSALSQSSLKESIPRVRSRYARLSGKRARSRLLDEFCAESVALSAKMRAKSCAERAGTLADPGATVRRDFMAQRKWRR